MRLRASAPDVGNGSMCSSDGCLGAMRWQWSRWRISVNTCEYITYKSSYLLLSPSSTTNINPPCVRCNCFHGCREVKAALGAALIWPISSRMRICRKTSSRKRMTPRYNMFMKNTTMVSFLMTGQPRKLEISDFRVPVLPLPWVQAAPRRRVHVMLPGLCHTFAHPEAKAPHTHSKHGQDYATNSVCVSFRE